MEEEKRVIKEPQHKQLIMDIGKTKYTVNLHFKQGTGETYKDKILKLIKRETEFKLCLSLFLNTVIPAFSTSWNHSIHYTKQSPLL